MIKTKSNSKKVLALMLAVCIVLGLTATMSAVTNYADGEITSVAFDIPNANIAGGFGNNALTPSITAYSINVPSTYTSIRLNTSIYGTKPWHEEQVTTPVAGQTYGLMSVSAGKWMSAVGDGSMVGYSSSSITFIKNQWLFSDAGNGYYKMTSSAGYGALYSSTVNVSSTKLTTQMAPPIDDVGHLGWSPTVSGSNVIFKQATAPNIALDCNPSYSPMTYTLNNTTAQQQKLFNYNESGSWTRPYTGSSISYKTLSTAGTTARTYAFTILKNPAVPSLSTYEVGAKTNSSVSLNLKDTYDGTVYSVAVPEGQAAPSAEQIMAGQNGDGQAVPASNAACPGGQSTVLTISGLSMSVNYTIYSVVKDTFGVTSVLGTLNCYLNNTDNSLTNLKTSSGSLSPIFNSATTDYTVNLPSNVASISITPTISQKNATALVGSSSLTDGKTYFIKTKALGKCIAGNGVKAALTEKAINLNDKSMQWTAYKSGGKWWFKNVSTGNMMDINGGTMSSGTTVQDWPGTVGSTNTAQQWSVVSLADGYARIGPTAASSLALDSNSVVRIWDQNGSACQYFTFMEKVESGQASTPVNLFSGKNNISVSIYAEDGSLKTYTLTVNNSVTDNLALGKKVISSGGTNPETVFDTVNNTTVRWDNTNSGDKWVGIDLGAVYNVNRLTTMHDATYSLVYVTKNFKYQGSVNGVDWYDITLVSNNSAFSNYTDITVTPVEARYVRLYITTACQDSSNIARIWEFSIFGSLPVNGNIALNKSYLSTSIEGTYYLRRGFNNITTDEMVSNASGNKWFMVDLEGYYDLTKIFIAHHDYGISTTSVYNTKAFSVEIGNDAVNWTSVYSTTTNTASSTTVTLSTPQKARYVRIYITYSEQNTNDKARIMEFKVFGSPSSDVPVNLTRNRTVVASSVNTTADAAVYAVDGLSNSTTNNWISKNTNNGTEWLTVTLDRAQHVKSWVLKGANFATLGSNYNTKDYRLETSIDGTTWTTADTVTGNTAAITDRTLAVPVVAKYVRLYITKPTQTTDNYARVAEFEVFGNELSSNCNLGNLTLTDGTISPEFAGNTTIYHASVANEVTAIQITPTTSDSYAKVTVNGSEVSSGQASGSIPIALGVNNCTIVVTAQNGNTKTYTLSVTRLPSSNAYLKALSINTGSLSPSFDKNSVFYSVSIGYAVKDIVLTPTLDDKNATVKVGGVTVSDGQNSNSISLKVGQTDIPVVVTAQDGTTLTYTVSVTRAGAPVFLNATPMKGAVLTTNTIEIIVNTDKSGKVYWVCLPEGSSSPNNVQTKAGLDSLGLLATLKGHVNTTGSTDTKYLIEGLTVGTVYDIYCIAEDSDGNLQDTPAVVSLSTLSNDAKLVSLATDAGGLTPAFSSDITSYAMTVEGIVPNISFTPILSDSRSTLEINNVKAVSGSPSSSISLNQGLNTITITVTAEDGSSKDYIILVTRYTPVSDVTLTETSLSLYQFETKQLVAIVGPVSALDKSVIWSSSNESVATVDVNGNVTAVSPGNTTITVITNDSGKTAECAVTVKEQEVVLSLYSDSQLKVKVYGWNADYKYQIWTYQKITSDIFINDSEKQENQWILSKGYTTGNAAFREQDGSISFFIDKPSLTPDGNYTVSVKVQNSNSNYVGQDKDTYTPEAIGDVKITKVLINGEYAQNTEVREIKAGASLPFEIIAVNSNAYRVAVNDTLIAPESSSYKFNWDISDKQPGTYLMKLIAKNKDTGSIDTQTVKFQLYSTDSNIKYAVINSMSISGQNNQSMFEIGLNPQTENADIFYYTIGEPGRSPLYKSEFLSVGSLFTKQLQTTQYGIYDIYGYVKRVSTASYDDGIRQQVTNKRSGNLTLDFFADNANINNLQTISGTKGTTIKFSAHASIANLTTEQSQYSYWRYDAKGYVLVKDWSNSDTLDWTPARAGQYSIQVRAKGTDAGSYEIVKSIKVNVDTNEIAQGVNISINQSELVGIAARTPIIIKASAIAANCENLLYKFYVNDDYLGTSTLQNYSTSQNCTWVPRKSGTYTISVLVKNSESFGMYDAIQNFTVVVK